MAKICSICSTETDSLTPLLNEHENFGDTGLSEMIKICGGIQIHRTNDESPHICNACVYKVSIAYKFHQTCQDLTSKLRLSSNKRLKSEYQNTASTQTAAPKLTLIINDIPAATSSEELKSIFSTYGRILDIYSYFQNQICDGENFARITFCDERASLSALRAAKCGELKLNGVSLAITAVSDFDSPIDILTDDCLRQIFMFILPEEKLKLEKVCQRWKRIAPFTWGNVTELDQDLLSDIDLADRLEFLTRCGKSLTDLNIELPENVPEFLGHVGEFCTNIENIGLGLGYEMYTHDFVQYLNTIFRRNEKIRRIRLLDIDDDVPFDFLNSLSEEVIEMHLCSKFCPLGISINSSLDLSKFRNLQVLSLENFQFAEKNDLRGIEFLHQLHYLRVSDCTINRNDIEGIQNFRNLKGLEIPEQVISDDVLLKIVNNNPGLKLLDISDLPEVSDRTFRCIVQLPQLERLIIKNLHGLNGYRLSRLRQIKALNCENCLSISDWELMILIEKARKLESINVAGCSITMRLIASAEESIKHQHEDRRLFIYVSNPTLMKNWKKLPDKSGKLVLSDCRFGIGSDFNWEEDWFTISGF